jgi:hypothetical protein
MRHFVFLFCSILFVSFAFASDSDTAPPAAEPVVQKPAMSQAQDQGRFAFGLNASGFLGYGGEVAARVTHHSNVRAAFNVIAYSHSLDKDSATYEAHLELRSFQAHYDLFPWANRGFHISPGMLAFLGAPLNASASINPGQQITLGGTPYTSDPANPARLNGKINFRQVSPMVTLGFKNIVPHKNKHFTIFPIDIGVAFTGSPKTTLNATGNLCDSSGSCHPSSNASVQQSIVAEQSKIDHSLRAFKVYPIISTGFTYKF